MRLVADYVPPPSQAELTAALLAAQRHLHSLGITSIQDACVGDAGEISMPDAFATYRRAAADRLLTCRVTGALWWDRLRGLHQLDTLQARREAGGRRRLLPRHLGEADARRRVRDVHRRDGRAVPGRPRARHRTTSGSLFIEPDELAEATGLLADLGFQMHFHAIGDRAVDRGPRRAGRAARRAAGQRPASHRPPAVRPARRP